jgi:hypothetical protein
MTKSVRMPVELVAWPGEVGPMTGHWSANQHHDDRAETYVRKDMVDALVKTALEKAVDIAVGIAESCAGNAEVYSPPYAGANEELRLLHTGGEQVCYQVVAAIRELIDQPKSACDNG